MDDVPATWPGTLRIKLQIRKAAMIAGNRLACSRSRHTSMVRAPAATSGPSTCPTLPPVPCSEMANPRLSGNFRESAPMAGG